MLLPAHLEMLLNLLLSFLTIVERIFQSSDVTIGVASASKGNRFPPAPRLVAHPFGECRMILLPVQVGMLFNLLLLFLLIQEIVFQLSDATNGVALASKDSRFPPAPSLVARPFGAYRTILLPVLVGMLLNLLLLFLTFQERVFQLSDVPNGVALSSKGNRFPPAPRLVAPPFGAYRTILLPVQLVMLFNLLLLFLIIQSRVFQLSSTMSSVSL